jgi:hypothetical protein
MIDRLGGVEEGPNEEEEKEGHATTPSSSTPFQITEAIADCKDNTCFTMAMDDLIEINSHGRRTPVPILGSPCVLIVTHHFPN